MKAVFLPMLVMVTSVPIDQPHTYLLSMNGIPLKPGERIERFKVSTWGVEFRSICKIPKDWEIKAGSFGPGGTLTGEAGHGASYIDSSRMTELNEFALVTLDGPVQKYDKRRPTGVEPATFSGKVSVQLPNDTSKMVAATFRIFKLKSASCCPPSRER